MRLYSLLLLLTTTFKKYMNFSHKFLVHNFHRKLSKAFLITSFVVINIILVELLFVVVVIVKANQRGFSYIYMICFKSHKSLYEKGRSRHNINLRAQKWQLRRAGVFYSLHHYGNSLIKCKKEKEKKDLKKKRSFFYLLAPDIIQ